MTATASHYTDARPGNGAERSGPSAGRGGRQPPHNLAAERSLLGSMLLSPAAIGDALQRLDASDFYQPAHSHVFDAIAGLYAAGSPVDSVLVAEYSAGRVSICPVLDNGVPDYTNNAAFITGLGGAEGSAIDPVTGDFLFSTFGGGNQVLVVTGFQQRCDLFFAGGGSCPLNYQPNPVTAISTCGSAGSPCATVCCQPKQPPPSGCVCDVLTVGSSCSRSTVQTSGRCLCMAFADAAPCEPTTSVQQPCP